MTARTKYLLAAICAVLVIGGVGLFFLNRYENTSLTQAPAPATVAKTVTRTTIGTSAEGRNIDAYTYGEGPIHLLFIGGIHGGYEWNSVLVAYQLIDYLREQGGIIPNNLTVAVIPSANPDGVYRVVKKEGRFTASDIPVIKQPVGTGRFNAHNVDLNRNFDCKWKPKSMWRGNVVDAGSAVFSEPEARAIRDFVLSYAPTSVVFWHSQANTVYASQCENGILPETLNIMNVYAKASGYSAVKSFDEYETSGDAEGWLASINIPAITVELKTHETIEWDQNLAGIKALFEYYRQKTI